MRKCEQVRPARLGPCSCCSAGSSVVSVPWFPPFYARISEEGPLAVSPASVSPPSVPSVHSWAAGGFGASSQRKPFSWICSGCCTHPSGWKPVSHDMSPHLSPGSSGTNATSFRFAEFCSRCFEPKLCGIFKSGAAPLQQTGLPLF